MFRSGQESNVYRMFLSNQAHIKRLKRVTERSVQAEYQKWVQEIFSDWQYPSSLKSAVGSVEEMTEGNWPKRGNRDKSSPHN